MTGETILITREYGRQAEFQREAARLCRQGWHIVGTLERPAPLSPLERLSGGLWSLVALPEREYLVTYRWEGAGPVPAPRLPIPKPPLARLTAATRRWWWAGAAAALVVAIVSGLANFFHA